MIVVSHSSHHALICHRPWAGSVPAWESLPEDLSTDERWMKVLVAVEGDDNHLSHNNRQQADYRQVSLTRIRLHVSEAKTERRAVVTVRTKRASSPSLS